MKKTLGIIMALALVLSLSIPAFAGTIGAGDTEQAGNTKVTYNSSATEGPGGMMYTVTIPSSVALQKGGDVPAEVKAENVTIGSDQNLKVFVEGDFKVKTTDQSKELSYEVRVTESTSDTKGEGTAIASGDEVLTTPSTDTDQVVTKKLWFTLPAAQVPNTTDAYEGTLTFNVKVE